MFLRIPDGLDDGFIGGGVVFDREDGAVRVEPMLIFEPRPVALRVDDPDCWSGFTLKFWIENDSHFHKHQCASLLYERQEPSKLNRSVCALAGRLQLRMVDSHLSASNPAKSFQGHCRVPKS